MIPRLSRILVAGALTLAALLVPTAASAADVGTNVYNGKPASEAYPFLVYVGGCTGSLIKANWVVTADHCGTPSSVRVGSTNRTSGGTVVSVVRAVRNSSIDVRLLQLASSVSYAPIRIPTTSGATGTATRIIGWGQATSPNPGGSTPVVATELDTSIVADSRCSGIFGAGEICTNNPGGAGACYGDSGGPQVRRENGVWVVIGVTSRAGNNSPTCGTAPSIYGDLPYIRSWVNTTVGGLPA